MSQTRKVKTNMIKKKSNKWDGCSLFSGCGGLDLGFIGDFNYKGKYYEPLGFDILAAYDFAEKAVEAYKLNISKEAFLADLTESKPETMPAHSVLIGGFPCQEFSICGPRGGLDSERGQLYKVFLKVMRYHRPKVVIAENVLNLLRMKNGTVIAHILAELEEVGYRFKVWNLYAPEYGVPQNRRRIFLVGVRDDILDFPECPVPTHVANYPSIDWAIDDLQNITDESVPNQSQYFKASKAKNGGGQGDETNKSGEPSYTIRANPRSRIQFHHRLPRRLTVRECARIQTFPDEFIFPFSTTANVQLIGNAVPPVLAHHVARSVAQFLLKIDN